ncbi:MAG: DUF488 domain-containing protein [Nocardioidaceae bacterium]
MGSVAVQRVYDPARQPGAAFLVDRLWPRGVSKDRLSDVVWLKTVAPSTELRRRLHSGGEQWQEFVDDYTDQLDALLAGNDAGLAELLTAARDGDIVLLYALRDEEHNHARLLADWIQAHR